jgi:hypothetical protein
VPPDASRHRLGRIRRSGLNAAHRPTIMGLMTRIGSRASLPPRGVAKLRHAIPSMLTRTWGGRAAVPFTATTTTGRFPSPLCSMGWSTGRRRHGRFLFETVRSVCVP